MVTIISCGVIDKNILFPIIAIIIYITINIIIVKGNPLFYKYKIMNNLLLSFSLFLAVFLYIYRRKKSIKLIKSKYYHEKRKKYKLYKFGLTLLIVSIDYIISLFELFNLNSEFDLWVLDTIIISIFSNYILKTKLYKHQYLSMIIILIIGIVLIIINFFNFKINYFFAFNVIENILYSLSLVLIFFLYL